MIIWKNTQKNRLCWKTAIFDFVPKKYKFSLFWRPLLIIPIYLSEPHYDKHVYYYISLTLTLKTIENFIPMQKRESCPGVCLFFIALCKQAIIHKSSFDVSQTVKKQNKIMYKLKSFFSINTAEQIFLFFIRKIHKTTKVLKKNSAVSKELERKKKYCCSRKN